MYERNSCATYEIATWMLVFTCVLLILAFFMLLAIFGRTQRKLTNEQSVFSVQTPQPSRNYIQRSAQPAFSTVHSVPNSSGWRDSVTDPRM